MYGFHIYTIGGGRAISFYDLSGPEISDLMRKIEKAELNSFVAMPPRKTKKGNLQKTFVLKSNISYYEHFREENNDS